LPVQILRYFYVFSVKEIETMSAQLDALTAAVAALSATQDLAIAKLNDLANNGATPAQIQGLIDAINADNEKIKLVLAGLPA
jgi:hypothetical protein